MKAFNAKEMREYKRKLAKAKKTRNFDNVLKVAEEYGRVEIKPKRTT